MPFTKHVISVLVLMSMPEMANSQEGDGSEFINEASKLAIECLNSQNLSAFSHEYVCRQNREKINILKYKYSPLSHDEVNHLNGILAGFEAVLATSALKNGGPNTTMNIQISCSHWKKAYKYGQNLQKPFSKTAKTFRKTVKHNKKSVKLCVEQGY